MQQVMSRHLFEVNKDLYSYLFITTHSEHIFAYMDDVNLIRVFRDQSQNIVHESKFFKVPSGFKYTRKVLNESLSYAFFYDKVFLVEGMSEKILFEGVIEQLVKQGLIEWTTLENILILSVEGIGFEQYVRYLSALGIKVIVKTDNDIRKSTSEEVSLLGINRCRQIYKILEGQQKREETEKFNSSDFDLKNKQCRDKLKKTIYQEYSDEIENWKSKGIYLSEIELEEDLYEILPEKVTAEPRFEGDFINYLQKAKKKNMNQFVNEYLCLESARAIYNDKKFECLKCLVEGEG